MERDAAHILVVDDDDRLRELLRKFLSENGFLVSVASDAADARARLAGLTFDLLVLDLMMPGESGLEFAESLRKTSAVPILMLTAMGEPEDRITGLEKGADDYLSKPFEPRELLLRIRSILRRVPETAAAPSEITMGDVVYDPKSERLVRDGQPIRLTSIEAALLNLLSAHSGTIMSREDLIEQTDASGGGRAIDVQVTRLRRKIEPDPKLPRYLQTVRGKGYVLRPD
ncbi:MAG: response regulator [Rhodospirillales bacterium]|jgi:two-component system, OmpR family, phosphate regulon response regulator OmpR|nr:response regulator [Rhodospirillales bacterium]